MMGGESGAGMMMDYRKAAMCKALRVVNGSRVMHYERYQSRRLMLASFKMV